MKERPILFTKEMVAAIRDDRKTMTRRLATVQPALIDGLWHAFYPWGEGGHGIYETEAEMRAEYDRVVGGRAPYGKPGDLLWVKETYAADVPGCGLQGGYSYRADHLDPKGDGPAHPIKWKSGRFMPRVASRFTLRVTEARLERLHSITDADAIREGIVTTPHGPRPSEVFQGLWDAINGKNSWSANPMVWVLGFEVMK